LTNPLPTWQNGGGRRPKLILKKEAGEGT
jgi:hypothetical protein